MVLIQVWSSCAFVTMAPLFWQCVPGALSSMVLFKYVGRFKRKLERSREEDVREPHTMERLSTPSNGKAPLQEVWLQTTHEG